MQHPNDNTPNELYLNILEARQQLGKLKQQANALEKDPFNSYNMKEYMKNVAYSLARNDQNIDRKIGEYKARLPSIHKQQKSDIDSSVLGGYRKYRKVVKQPSTKRASEQSTKIQNSFSFSVQNRPVKIHSNYEKHIKPEFSQVHIASDSQIPAEILQLKQQTSNFSSIQKQRSRHLFALSNIQKRNYSTQKKKVSRIDLNISSSIQQNTDILRPPQQYNQVVDKYSKHEFMIIRGVLANQGPEYASYCRIYESIIDKIQEQIKKIEGYVVEKEISFVRLDGKKLAYLCLKQQIKKSELIDCLIDEKNQLKRIFFPATKYQGKKGRHFAASKIQSLFKMLMVRQRYSRLLVKTRIIQAFFRKNIYKLNLQRRIHERNSRILNDFQNRQEQLQQKWKQIKKKKRIQIHLNSIEVDQEKRLSIQNFSQRQNIQLSRIFRLKDQNLIIIYVSAFQLSSQLINYYYKMLQLAGIPKYEDRLLFFTPSNASCFPQHFSVSKLLYYSSKTMKQIKIISEDLPTVLVPGYPSNELVKICDFLKCYLYSGSPQQIKPFTTRSQTLSFLKNLCIPCLPSQMEMYDYGQFLNTFSVLISKNADVKVWILKIDDEFSGRGIASFDVGKLKFMQRILSKITPEQSDFFTTDLTSTQNQQIIMQIRDYLKQNLPEKLLIATPTVYRSYSEFMGRFIKKGGVIQAKPIMQSSQILQFPSFSFFVEPNGQHTIFASYQKIHGSLYRSYACSFPQKSLEFKQASSIIRKIAESFKIRKIFGFFTVDFVVCSNNPNTTKISSKTDISKRKQPRFWVLDIDPFINNYTASFFLFDVLMSGSYFPQKNMYLVERQIEKDDDQSVDTMTSNINSNFNGSLIERSYIFIPHFFNQNLFMVKIKDFFKQARIQQFNFDIGNKQGLCIMLLDSLTSGTMSMMAVSKNYYESVIQLKNILEFIVKISAVKNVTYGRTDSEPSTDKILIKDMLNMFSTMVRKDQRSNAKAKALKQFQNSQNLGFIY